VISSLELARLSGCSQGTVDRALHNRSGISKTTREKILALAEKHGYRPHPAARELLTGDRRTIGAIIPSLNSVFFMDLMNTVREALNGYRFVITQVASAQQFQDMLEEFASLRARLALVVPPEPNVAISASILQSLGVASLVNPCLGRGVTNLIPDEVETGKIGTRYLLSRGHRNIVHLCPKRNSSAIEKRARGFRAAMAEHRLTARVITDWTSNDLPQQLRKAKATAIFCHNDWLALTAMRSLTHAGVRVPADLSILGVDDSQTFTALCPDISTLHYPAESIARAVRALIDGEPVPTIDNVTVVERATVQDCRGH